MRGHLGTESLWSWAQAWLFPSTALIYRFSHRSQRGNRVRECGCLFTTFWLKLRSYLGDAVGQRQDTNGDSFVSQIGKLRRKIVELVSTNWIHRTVKCQKQGVLLQKRILHSSPFLAPSINSGAIYTPRSEPIRERQARMHSIDWNKASLRRSQAAD